ncbi:procathepsin L-like [Leucoraja erinacea]|uniref:procathepsin L-like n=1 Tax=Leucoraja erinaceus TaxID=7782 RepID=UPI0024562A2B|nr:procathepsin L-like [Leucoraja erinacea]
MDLFLFVACILVGVPLGLADPLVDEEWDVWKQSYGKIYSNTEEDQARRGVWLENLWHIQAHNVLYSQGNSSYKMAMNQFGDLTSLEFNQLYTDKKIYEFSNLTIEGLFDVGLEESDEVGELGAFPRKIDWRQDRLVRKVKHQGRCSSCYAFSAIGALEGQLAKKKHQYMELSEQNIIDCSDEFKNYGCRGGLPYRAFKYMRDYGIQSSTSYPYRGKRNDKCLFNSSQSVIKIKGFKRFKNNKDKQLARMVARVGPISVLIHSSHSSWRFYKSGVYDNSNCKQKLINHSVLLIGYVDRRSKSYWIIKNSWGTSWGENGYMRIIKGKNMCGINYCAAYPEI